MSDKYSNEQVIILLDNYFRDAYRPAPFEAISDKMGVTNSSTAISRLLWGVVTGYGGACDLTLRLAPEWPKGAERCRSGRRWWTREDHALRNALAGEGQRRKPPLTVAYIATVLARTEEEVELRWEEINKDALGRKGFF